MGIKGGQNSKVRCSPSIKTNNFHTYVALKNNKTKIK